MKKHLLVIGIIFLFFISAFTPMTTGLDTESSEIDVELERMLDNLRFMCMGPDGLIVEKYEHYKEQLLSMYSSEDRNYDIVEQEVKELATQVEPSSYPIVSSGGPMDSAWPMKCHDNKHTGLSPYSTADNPYDEKWRFKTYMIEDTPVIAEDGTIYFGGGLNVVPHLIAVNPDGTEKWRFRTEGLIFGSSPAIAEDGTIYFGCWDDFFYAINPDGTLKWKFYANNANIASSPAIAEDGTIYFGDLGDFGYDTRIYAINPNGTEKWHYTINDRIYSDPCIGDDGTIYIGSNDKHLYALNPDGTLKWRFKTGEPVGGSPSIADDGTIYFAGTWDNYFYALYPNNGTIKWKCNIFVSCANPSIDSNGIIYVGGDEELYAVYPNGTVKWSFDLGNERWIGPSTPAISADGTIYVGVCIEEMSGGYIIAVNPDGTEQWRKKIASECVHSSPSIAEDGTVYIGGKNVGDDYLYAFGVRELDADANGPYYGLTNQSIQFTGISSGGHSPHSYFWEFGDTHTSEEQNPIHTYTSAGNYNVVFTVTDNKSNTVIDATFAWIQTTNTAPDKPTINGQTNGDVGVTYDYTFSATDPDESIIYFYVDWGDETNTGWIGPYNSGVTITKSHKWTNQGTFTIKAKAKDPYNDEGPWGELTVTMPRNKATNNVLFWRLLERFPNAFPILRHILGLN